MGSFKHLLMAFPCSSLPNLQLLYDPPVGPDPQVEDL